MRSTRVKPRRLVAWRYNRVSNDRKGQSKSIPEQNLENLAVIEDNGWDDGGEYADPGSASRFTTKLRKEWERLLTDLKASPPDVLVMWEPSRGTRRLTVWSTLLETCRNLKVKIHITSHHETYDLNNPRHWRTLAEDGVDAEYEVSKTSMRIRRHLGHNAAAGRPHGRVTYGFRRIYNEHTKAFMRQEIDETQAEVIRKAAHEVAWKAATLYAVREGLNTRGVPSPDGKAWSSPQLRKMLTNPAYIGKRVHQGKVLGDACWEPILDELTFYTCVRLLTDPERKTAKDTAVRHLLSGIATCARGGLLRVAVCNGIACYQCSEHHCVTIREEWLDDWVTGLVLKRLSREDALKLLASPAREQEAASAANTLEDTEALLREWRAKAGAGEIDPEEYVAITAPLKTAVEALRKRVARLRVSPVLRDAIGPDIGDRWPTFTLPRQREIIRDVLEIQVLPVGRGYHRGFDPKRVQTRWRQMGGALPA